MEVNQNSASTVPKIVGAIVAILLCCACAVIVAAAGILYFQTQTVTALEPFPSLLPVFGDTTTPPPTIELTRPPIDSIPPDSLQTLLNTNVPENNPYDLACRLEGLCNVSETVQGKAYQVGDVEQFWILNSDNVDYNQINARLLYVTEHSYFWAETGVDANLNDVQALMDAFEQQIYPNNREFFGSELNPGVDGDPRIFVIYTSRLGSSVAGVFNSTDSYNPAIEEYSNGHETFMFSSIMNLASPNVYSTLAHEFVHTIQFASDRNDDIWITEGFAEVGAFLNGYGGSDFEWFYIANPDLQLNDWSSDIGSNGAHYGQSFLYLTYYLDRFGEEATKALTANPENGLHSVDDTLSELNFTDPQTGQPLTADDLFMDWSATLYLMDAGVGDGRYTYHNHPNAPRYTPPDFVSNCPETISDTVHQYGIDYLAVNCIGEHTLHFSGSTVTSLLPTKAYSGEYALWSNKGDYSNMTLTREFDFTGVSGPITFSYQTWYNIEQDWDYLYLEASTDGRSWQILETPSGTGYDPIGQSYGWAYTGSSGGWIQEEVDLSRFAGRKVQVRFEYVTDVAVNEEGLLLDDVRVDAVNYAADFEVDDGGWVGEGFARVQNALPQTYRLSLILKRNGATTVTPITLNADNTAEIPISLDSGDEAVLIVTGTTRFTTVPTAYQVEIK